MDALRAIRVNAEYRGAGDMGRALLDVEQQVESRLLQSQARTDAVADANARCVELLTRLDAVKVELERQNGRLSEQNERIETARLELERQARALADANASAVVELDAVETRAAELASARADLVASNAALAARSAALTKAANALADANVDAVALVEERESALIDLQKKRARELSILRGLEVQAHTDELTSMFNRRYFKEHIIAEFAKAIRYGRNLGVVFIDIDHFKWFNDTNGHVAGDVLLTQIAHLIRTEIRAADVLLRGEGGAFAVRYGGEEFVLVLPETGIEGAARVAERLRARIESTKFDGADTQPGGRLTISAGVASLRRDDHAAADLVSRADAALYLAKRARNRVEIAPEEAAAEAAVLPSPDGETRGSRDS